MSQIIGKIVLCLFLGALILIGGFFGVIVTTFSGAAVFYIKLEEVIVVVLFIFIVLMIFRVMKRKRLLQGLGIFFVICIIASAGHEIMQVYDNRITMSNEQSVDLNKYKPFAENTKAVALQEASTLKITSNPSRLDGATALYPLYSSFAKAVYTPMDYNIYNSEVMCNTTEAAYKNLIEGQADIIFSARPSNGQLEEAKRRGMELKLTPIGREAFVFFVNSKNKIERLSTKQIQDIYSGEITNWKEVGGKNDKIKAFQRPENSGSQSMLQKLMEGKHLMIPPKEDIVTGMDGIIEQTSNYRNYKNAIGYSFLFYATEMVKNNEIRLLKVDGIYPSRDTIKNKEYPLGAEFYAVTAGSTNPNVEAFINWILGPQGQYLIEKIGYTPLN
jgi:phosphate transport system substrate-binding protein